MLFSSALLEFFPSVRTYAALFGVSFLAALGSAFDVKSSRQTETGYERTGQVDGRMVTEQWDSASGSGSYGVLVAHRFMVNADGTGVKADDLKNAVTAVGFKRLEKLAR